MAKKSEATGHSINDGKNYTDILYEVRTRLPGSPSTGRG